jgi:enoyl-[acyl-carrier protein] reductase II
VLPTRSLKTELTRRLLELEASGASADAIRDFLGTSRARKGQIEGDLVNGEVYAGASVGLIREILPAATVVQRMVEEYKDIIQKIK